MCLCYPGYTCPDGSPCVTCVACTFKVEPGDSVCEACCVNEYSGTSTAACVACHANLSSMPRSPGLEHCLCDPGFYQSEGKCSMSHAGCFKNTTVNEPCQSCTGNTFTLELDTMACTSCLLSSWFSTDNPSEDGVRCQCITGYTQTELNLTTSACIVCQPDTYQPSLRQGQTTCELFDPSASPGGLGHVDHLPLQHRLLRRQSSRMPGLHGRDVQGVGGRRRHEDTEPCDVCPDDSFSLAQIGRLAGCLCNPGFIGPDSCPCPACASGKFKAGNCSYACEDCPLHTYSDETASTVCSLCTVLLQSVGGITELP